MSDDLPDLSEFDKYLDDEDLEKLKRSEGGGSGSEGPSNAAGGRASKGRKGKGGPRRWLWLLVGMAVGVAGTIFLPDLVRPYLPPALRLGETEVAGLVLDKRREGERLLLTVDTERGATLATFTRRVSEIDLLVGAGDSVTLGLGAYAPLVEDPTLAGVRKGPGEGAASGAGPAPDSGARGAEEAPDTGASAGSRPDTAGG